MHSWCLVDFSVPIPHLGVPAGKARKEWLILRSYLRRSREAEATRRKQEAEAEAARRKAANIVEAAENADILKTRVKDRVSEARKHFVGRAWLAERLLSSLDSVTPHKAILITGIAGTGKSYFFDRLLDAVACNNLGGNWAQLHGRMLARHCCMYGHRDSLNPTKFLNSLIAQVLRVTSTLVRPSR